MASKKYAYYNKGNKIAIVEQSATTSSGKMAVAHCTISGYSTKDTCEAAGGQWIPGSSGSIDSFGEYTSPVETIADGLEIEYSYIPTYQSPYLEAYVNTFGINGWTVVDGYLTFLSSMVNWTASPYTVVAANDYIYSSSQRWGGVHKVQEVQSWTGSHGGIKTYTKVNRPIKYFTSSSVTWNTNETITIVDNNFDDIFTTDDYLWITGSDAALTNTGLFSGWSFSGTTLDLSAGKQDYYNHATDTLIELQITPVFSADPTNVIYMREAFKEKSYIVSDVNIMEDESFDLDLTRGQAKAVVYYLKAMQSEYRQDLEAREYFLALFRTEIGRNSAARKRGPYIASGHWNMK